MCTCIPCFMERWGSSTWVCRSRRGRGLCEVRMLKHSREAEMNTDPRKTSESSIKNISYILFRGVTHVVLHAIIPCLHT